jgi:hypothetical protein
VAGANAQGCIERDRLEVLPPKRSAKTRDDEGKALDSLKAVLMLLTC